MREGDKLTDHLCNHDPTYKRGFACNTTHHHTIEDTLSPATWLFKADRAKPNVQSLQQPFALEEEAHPKSNHCRRPNTLPYPYLLRALKNK
jgi:hypothetical protein